MPSEILKTYGDVSIREDVNSFVELITALEAWFLNNLGKTQAYGPVHQTQVDTLNINGVVKFSLIDSEIQKWTTRAKDYKSTLNDLARELVYYTRCKSLITDYI